MIGSKYTAKIVSITLTNLGSKGKYSHTNQSQITEYYMLHQKQKLSYVWYSGKRGKNNVLTEVLRLGQAEGT